MTQDMLVPYECSIPVRATSHIDPGRSLISPESAVSYFFPYLILYFKAFAILRKEDTLGSQKGYRSNFLTTLRLIDAPVCLQRANFIESSE